MSNKICDAPVGVFDSGVGGLTVAREIIRQLPGEKIVYFGDTARVPYGTKSRDTIIKYSRQIVKFLKTKGVKAIVVACNTASAYALDVIESESDIPIIGVVKPGAKVAVAATRNKRVGIIGTDGTIGSGLYTKYIQSKDKGIEVIGKACPLFVPLVEEGMIKDEVTEEMARRYLGELRDKNIDTLILGCTHYPLLRHMIGEIMGDRVQLVNPAYETAMSLKGLLERERLLSQEPQGEPKDMHRFYVSDDAGKFMDFANSILPFDISMIQKINIEDM